jgi:O-antigen/teichoic acid export membrane protein
VSSGSREGRGRSDGEEPRAVLDDDPARSRRDGSAGHGRRDGRDSRESQLAYPFFEYVTGNIDLGQLGSFGRIDFEPRLYGSPRPLERTDPDPPYNWRSYERSAPDGTGYAVDDLLERLDVPSTEGLPRPRAPRAPRVLQRPGDDLPARRATSGRSRAILTLLDQILSSGTNAVMSFLVARQVTASEFGAFGIAFAVFAVVVGFSRSVGTAPLGMRFSDANRGEFRRASRSATGTALTLALFIGAVTAGAGFVLGGAPGRAVLAMGVVIPGLLLQDSWRYVFFAQGRPGAAAANDLLWAMAQGVAFAGLLLNDVHSAPPYILVWGAAAAGAALVGAAQAGVWPSIRDARAWITEHREIAGYLSAEFVTVQGALQMSTLLIGTLGTLEIVGALRGTQTLLGPTQVLAIGILSFAIPELARRKDMTARQMMRAAWTLSAVVTGAGLAWGGFFLLVPDSVGVALLHDSWPLTRHILPASVVQQAGTAMMIGPACVLYSLGRARVTFRLHATQAPLLLVLSIGGLELAGAQGTAWGYAVAFWTLVPLSFILLRREAHAAERERGLDRLATVSGRGGPGRGGSGQGGPGRGGSGQGGPGRSGSGHREAVGDDRSGVAGPPAVSGGHPERLDHLGEPFRDGDGPDAGGKRRSGTVPRDASARRAFPRGGPGSTGAQ